MCIRYNVEFWMPCDIKESDWESKVRRGLARPGTNTKARRIIFFECGKGRFLKASRCAIETIEEGGTYGGRIFDFCYQDDDCFLRLKELEAQTTEDRQVAKQAENERWPTHQQAEATRFWKESYDGWTSAYENHRECPSRRYYNKLYTDLRNSFIVSDHRTYSNDLRLGTHPGTAEEPISGIPRHYDAPERRY